MKVKHVYNPLSGEMDLINTEESKTNVPKFEEIVDRPEFEVTSGSSPDAGEVVFLATDKIFVWRTERGYFRNWATVLDYMTSWDGMPIKHRLFECNGQYYVFDGESLVHSTVNIGGSGIELVHGLGDSTEKAMSQAAVTNLYNQGYKLVGTATPSTTPVTITGSEKVFYIAIEKGDYSNFGLGAISELILIKSENGSWSAEGLGVNLTLKDSINTDEDSALYVTDNNGNIVAKINNEGISTTDVKIKDENGELKSAKQDSISELYNDSLFVTDSAGNVIFKLDKNGLKTINIESDALLRNQWNNKIIATYGDSVTALNGGDFEYPFEINATNAKWAGKVAKYFNFAKLHNRGIGSTCFAFRNNGGQVAWCNTTTGEYVDRNDNFNYDNYFGNVTIPEDCTPIRGDGSSWLRIKTMFPEAIKNTIDIILVMFHNDYAQDMETDALWVENSSVDTEWYADNEHYSKYNGDYNINTVKGGIASTIMKLSEWMPNALIVLMTPISGVHRNTEDEFNFNLENPKSENMKKLAETVKDISFRMSIPCIDVYGNDCINSLNKDEHITDRESSIGIHPYTDSGCKRIARAIISKLISEIPNL